MTLETTILTPANLAQHALAHVRQVAKTGRGSATDAEREAAEYVQAQLASMGVPQVKLQPFSGERSLWLFVAMAFGLTLVGHAAFWLLKRPLGALAAVIIAWIFLGFSGYLVWCKFTKDDYPLSSLLPHGPSQNVLAVIPPAQAAERKLVLVAHLDSHRAVFWFATDFLVRIFSYIAASAIFGIYLAMLVYGLAVLSGWQVFSWVAALLILLHFLSWFSGVTADLGQYSPGANDNASAVGSLLALAERLTAQPLQSTEVWLAFTGCEETSGDGMLALLKEYGQPLKEAFFLNLEMVGVGDALTYLRQEGNMRPLTIAPDVEAFIKAVGQPYGISLSQAPLVGAATECSILWRHGLKAVAILAHYKGSTLMPEWHRLTDTADRLQVSSLERVHRLAWDILQRFDQGGISPLPAVEDHSLQ
jgi:hypothetical protein